ncbi:MAG: rhodanese-like domain-containing protein, partial [Acidobacteriota bacterium]
MNTSRSGRRMFLILALIILVVGVMPVAGYWYWIARHPALTPQQAWEMLKSPNADTLLVDVRNPDDFAEGHLEEAVNWPFSEIVALSPGSPMPRDYEGKRLILICSGGIMEALAAGHLAHITDAEIFYVHGGMQEWIAHGNKPCGLALLVNKNSVEKTSLPFHPSSGFEQSALILSGFVMKPIYMILSLIVILILRRSKAPDLVALRWSMVFFLSGEIACMFNYLIFTHESHIMEYLHGFGMVAGFSFAAYALLEAIDTRLIRLSDPDKKCAALSICRSCIKYGTVPCRLRQIFYFGITALAVLAVIPFFSPVRAVSYNTQIYGTFYNFSHSVLYQIYEIRFCPAMAIIFFAVSLP